MDELNYLQLVTNLCETIYVTLGVSHSECVYQKALIIELYNHGAISVEFEKHVPVFYHDSKGSQHTIGSERIDILARFPDNIIVLMELKAQAGSLREHVEISQLKKYVKSLKHIGIVPTISILVNFPQNSKNETDIEIVSLHSLK